MLLSKRSRVKSPEGLNATVARLKSRSGSRSTGNNVQCTGPFLDLQFFFFSKIAIRQDAYANRKERLPRLSICMRFSHHKARKSCMRQWAKRKKNILRRSAAAVCVRVWLNSKKESGKK